MSLKHAFLIVAHKQPDLLIEIMSALAADNHFFFVNLDKKMKGREETANKLRSLFPEVFISYNNVFHGGYSQVKVTIDLLQEAEKHNIDYFHLISGQDFPCKSISEFNDFFDSHRGESYMWYDTEEQNELWQKTKYAKRLNYFNFNEIPGGKFLNPIFIRLKIRKPIVNVRAGWNWFSWHSKVVRYVLSQYKNDKRFFNRFKYTRCCDEIVFHTLLFPKIEELRIHADNSLRYINWNKKSLGRSTENAPLILNEDELIEITGGDYLFCRKIDEFISRNLIKELKIRIASELQ